MGAAAGVYGAIAVGFFASVFGGTRTVISGPAPSITIAMAIIVTSQVSTLSEALIVVVLAGSLQVLLGLSRLGRFIVYTPHVVVSGFMSGIGAIIILMQVLPFVGAPVAPGGTMAVFVSLPEALNNVNGSAVAIAAVTLVVVICWPRHLSRYLPALLLALFVGTMTGVLWLHQAPVIGEIPSGLPALQFQLPSWSFLLHAVEPALIIALLASVDSLLACLIADSLTGSRHNPDRELVGLISLRGSFTVASSRKLVEVIGEDIKEHEVVIFDFSDTLYVDDSAALVMERLLAVADEQGTGTIVMGLSGSVSNSLAAFGVLQRVPEWRQVGSMDEARERAAALLQGKESI